MRRVPESTLLLFLIGTIAGLGGDIPVEPGHRFIQLLNVELEVTYMASVLDSLGVTQIIVSGDGEGYSKRACYYLSRESCYVSLDQTSVGGGGLIHQYTVATEIGNDTFRVLDDRAFDSADCGGIRLGITKEEFKRILGVEPESDSLGTWAWFEHSIPCSTLVESHTPCPDVADVADVSITVTGVFVRDTLTSFSVFKFTTY